MTDPRDFLDGLRTSDVLDDFDTLDAVSGTATSASRDLRFHTTGAHKVVHSRTPALTPGVKLGGFRVGAHRWQRAATGR